MAAADPSPASAFSRVLQGQELSTFRGTFKNSNESDSCDKTIQWTPSVIDEEKVDSLSVSRRYGSDKQLPVGRTSESSVTDLLSGFGSTNGSANEFSRPSEGKFNFHSNPWSIMPSGLSLSLMNDGMKTALQGGEISYQTRDVRYSAFDEYSVHNPNQSGKWLMPPPVPLYLQMPSVKQNEIMKPKDGNCKIFGVPLAGNRNASDVNQGLQSQEYPTFDSDRMSEQSKLLKVVDNLPASKEQDKEYQNFQPFVRDNQAKVQGVSTRSCTKVFV